MWQPNIDTSKRGIYKAIVSALRHDIESGVLKSGDKLPPAARFGLGIKT